MRHLSPIIVTITKMAAVCVVCLGGGKNYKNLNTIDQNNTKISTKLNKCVPEVPWKDDTQICLKCLEQLENVYKFHELCIKSFMVRQKDEINQEIEHNCICYDCNGKFESKDDLIEHIAKEHRKVIVEPISNGDFNSTNCRDDSAIKIKDNVVKSSENICDQCGKSFNNKYLLKRHLRNVHATEKLYKCDLCERKFATSVYLNAHKHYHNGERKHICTYCGKGYITTSDLYHHEKIHLNRRSYHCDKCPKQFNTSSDLHKHRICVHLDRNEWKYVCDYCEKRFPLKTNLDTHIKIHTEVLQRRILRCIACGCTENNEIRLHCFPRNPEKRQKWLEALDVVNKSVSFYKNERLCSQHFSTASYTYPGSGRLLAEATPNKLNCF